jgi:hypothetical protein
MISYIIKKRRGSNIYEIWRSYKGGSYVYHTAFDNLSSAQKEKTRLELLQIN